MGWDCGLKWAYCTNPWWEHWWNGDRRKIKSKEKTVPVSLFPPPITQGQLWGWNWASTFKSQWLFTWALEQQCMLTIELISIWLSHCFSIYIYLVCPVCWCKKKIRKNENWVANINQNSNFLCKHPYHITVTTYNLLHILTLFLFCSVKGHLLQE